MFEKKFKRVKILLKGGNNMNKFLVILAAPSMHFFGQEDNYIEPYIVEFTKETTMEQITQYIDEKLMRKFSLDYSVSLKDVRIVAAARVK